VDALFANPYQVVWGREATAAASPEPDDQERFRRADRARRRQL
jgi:hypothetical protein